jgi:hypothetical protein
MTAFVPTLYAVLMARRCTVAVLGLAVTSASALTQVQDKPGQALGSIRGRVYCADTNAAARMAKVLLMPVKVTSNAPQGNVEGETSLPGAGTDFDGTFRIDNVPAGEYYIYAVLPGYVNVISAFSAKELQSADKKVSDHVRQKVSTVLVAENAVTEVQLRIERAGAISGTVRYDDGTPVPDATVTLLDGERDGETRSMSPKAAKMISPFLFDQVGTVTDDRGRFRVASLPEGKYSAKVTLAGPKRIQYRTDGDMVDDSGNQMNISVFLGDTLHWKDAGTLALGAGEEKYGVDITVPIRGLHTVEGKVEAKADGHRINTGTVRLTGTDDPSLKRTIALQDGAFEFDFVPEGRYVISVEDAKDTKGRNAQAEGRAIFVVDTLRKFGAAQMPVIVQTTDVKDLVLEVPASK